jgi:hypothetical protein
VKAEVGQVLGPAQSALQLGAGWSAAAFLCIELRCAGDRQPNRRRALRAGARDRRSLLDATHARFDLFPRVDRNHRDLGRRGDRVAPRARRDPGTAIPIVPPTALYGSPGGSFKQNPTRIGGILVLRLADFQKNVGDNFPSCY